MSRPCLIAPDVFIAHATRLRALKLEQIASSVKQDLRMRPVPAEQAKPPRPDFSSVLRGFRGRIR